MTPFLSGVVVQLRMVAAELADLTCFDCIRQHILYS